MEPYRLEAGERGRPFVRVPYREHALLRGVRTPDPRLALPDAPARASCLDSQGPRLSPAGWP